MTKRKRYIDMELGIYKKTFYCYVYLDPRKPGYYKYGDWIFDYEPIWVGKGNGIRWKISNHLRHNSGNRLLENKLNKIGESNVIVIFPLIDSGLTCEKYAFLAEKTFISNIGRLDLGTGPLCNLTNGGDGQSGLVHTEETKKKISESEKGKSLSSEHKRKIGEAHKGRIISEETKEKIRQAKLGKKHTEEHKRKVSETLKQKYSSGEIANSNKGKKLPPLSDGHKQKISEGNKKAYSEGRKSNKGKKWTEEQKKKFSEKIKEEYQNGFRKSSKGAKRSEESCQRMSEAQKKRYENLNNISKNLLNNET